MMRGRGVRVQKIEIDFPVPVDLASGFEQTIYSLVGMVCKAYQKDRPTRSMWLASVGVSRRIFRSLGKWRWSEVWNLTILLFYIEVLGREPGEKKFKKRLA